MQELSELRKKAEKTQNYFDNIPVFNEEDTIPIFYKTVREYEPLKSFEVEIVFTNTEHGCTKYFHTVTVSVL